MSWDCREISHYSRAYLEGADRDDHGNRMRVPQARVARHLAACPQCREEYFDQAWGLLLCEQDAPERMPQAYRNRILKYIQFVVRRRDEELAEREAA